MSCLFILKWVSMERSGSHRLESARLMTLQVLICSLYKAHWFDHRLGVLKFQKCVETANLLS